MRLRLRRPYSIISLAAVTAAVACTLNPQPLPPVPDDNNAAPGSDAGAFGSLDSSRNEPDPSLDAAGANADSGAHDGDASPLPIEDGGDAGDGGGDAGDGGDSGI